MSKGRQQRPVDTEAGSGQADLFEDMDLPEQMKRSAAFSPCKLYRYQLWREWGEGKPVVFIGLNPSTADERFDDPTIRRCIRFAQDWGFKRMVMANLFAFRATDPKVMKRQDDPIGPDNDGVLQELAAQAGLMVAAWGVHGKHLERDVVVRKMLPELHCLKLTKDGMPGHPLYLPAAARPFRWQQAGQV